MEKLSVHNVAYHRNGIGGEGFYIVLFQDTEHNPDGRMVAIHFPHDQDIYTAILDIDQLAAGNIAFAEGNSWHGDYYHPFMTEVIRHYNQREDDQWSTKQES
jgi:hypothetical protein